MPSKSRKHSKTPLKLSYSESSPSEASSTPTPSEPKNEEEFSHSLLEEASLKFPSLIRKDAFIGRIADVQSNSGSPAAEIWLSESAMVSSSLVPGSIVSVSLSSSEKEHLGDSPLKSLVDQCGRLRNVDTPDDGTNMTGTYFALALVFPSCKVLKNAVRLSWSLACTMGNPALGKVAFVFPIQTPSMTGFLNGSNKLQYSLITSDSGLSFRNCKDLYLELVPSTNEVSINSNSTSEARHHQLENRNSSSPKTPASYRLQLNSQQVSNGKKSPDLVSNVDYSKGISMYNVEEALRNEKSRELLHACASLWLRARYLLPGNRVSIPMGGQTSVFDVLDAEHLTIECPSDESVNEGPYVHSHNDQTFNLEHFNCAFLMNYKTKVHMNSSVTEIPDRRGFTPVQRDRGKAKDTVASHVLKLGGLSKEYNILKDIISSLSMKGPLIRWGLKPMKGVLLHGPPGTGKTSLARSCVFDAGIELFEVNGPEIISQFHGESEQALHEIFDSASKVSPAAVFIDELDAIAPARKDGGDELSQILVATLLNLMDGISGSEGVLVIATTNRPDSIDPALRRPGRLEREIEIGVPSPRQRLDILQSLLHGMDHALVDSQIQYLASVTHGFVGADLASLCDQAALVCLRRLVKSTYSDYSSSATNHSVQLNESCIELNACSGDLKISSSLSSVNGHNHTDPVSSYLSDLMVPSESVQNRHSDPETQHVEIELENVDHISNEKVAVESKEECFLKMSFDDFEMAMRKVRPSAMREIILEIPKVSWGDVGGQKEVKQQLREAVEWPRKHHEDCQRIGTQPPTGLLLYGPPGCSKTLMARAVASEAGLNFLSVKGPELFSKWVGESEKAVRTVFAKARANAPSIIFFDEIDGLAVIRGVGNDGASVSDRVISQLLVEMDGLHTRVDVTVIAATNRPDKIDPALLRPGRFDRLLYVGPPSEADREDIFRIHVRGKPCSPDVSIKELARLTDGCTGADISLICREAGLAAIAESLDDASEVSMEHFRSGIERVQPSKVRYDQDFGSKFQRFVRSDKRIDDSGNKPGSTTRSIDVRSLWKSPFMESLLTTCIFAPCSFFVARWIYQYYPLILYDKHR